MLCIMNPARKNEHEIFHCEQSWAAGRPRNCCMCNFCKVPRKNSRFISKSGKDSDGVCFCKTYFASAHCAVGLII